MTALACGLVAIFLRNADLSRVGAALVSARVDLLLLALLLTGAMSVIRAERWQCLLEPIGPTRFWTAFRTTIIGFAASFVLPARAGEVLRPYLLARREGLAATAAFATIVIERLLDLAAMLGLLFIALVFFPAGEAAAAPWLYRAILAGGAVVGSAVLVLLVVLFVLAGRPERLHVLVLQVTRWLPVRVARLAASLARTFAEGLSIVRRPSRLAVAMLWSIALWVTIASQAWLALRAFEIVVPFGGAFLLTALLVVGVAVPTPGGVGGTHEALRLGVTAFYGADNDAAVAAAIVQHAVNFVPYLVLGAWFLAQDGLTLGRLKHLAARARAAETPAVEAAVREVIP